ncbi:MAG: very short patch repair endonuclease [Pirellulaceae bacterium]
MDSVNRAVRSHIMSRIKQRDSAIERQLRSAVWRAGLRYRKNVRIHGTPDLVFRSAKVLVFVDSCFWHGCRFHCRMPKSNVEFWKTKIMRNRRRDLRVTRFYRRRGWTVLRFWEHQLLRDPDGCVNRVIAAAGGNLPPRPQPK